MNNDFIRFLNSIEPELKKVIGRVPGIIKVEGLQFIHDNFARQGFESSKGSVDKWKPRKPLKGNKQAQKNNGRAILIKTGNLQRSWDRGATAEPTRVVFSSDKPYAEPHNEGSKVQPMRKMIGDSAALDARMEVKITKLIDSVLK